MTSRISTPSAVSRRQFLGTTASAAGVLALGTPPFSAGASEKVVGEEVAWKTSLQKGWLVPRVTAESCAEIAAAGFAGIEVTHWDIPVAEAEKARKIAEENKLSVHSVMRGWANFNHADENVVQKSIDETAHAMRVAAALGAGVILLVPCRVSGKLPEAWDIDITFDPKTLEVSRVVDGDNAPFTDYIAAQNHATQQSIRAIESLLPLAEELKMTIAVENVWNNLWSSPELLAAFVNHFQSPWVKTYFDLGNHAKYRRCEDWLKILGSSIVRLHIKGYRVTEPRGKFGGGVGDWASIDQASINWREVRKIIDEIGYNGFVSVEEGGHSLKGYSEMLDQFFAGQLEGKS